MALQRPEGWPFSISEYNTPAPNDHGAEIFPLFAAIASLQDWDAFYSYTYRDFGKDYENTFIKRYFHFIGRAATLVHLPASSLAFRNRWIQPGAQRVVCTLPRSQVADLSATYGDLPGLWRALQADPGLAWMRATAVRLTDTDEPPRLVGDAAVPAGVRRSDTGELRWEPRDPAGPWFTVSAPAVRFVIGHVGGRTFEVGDVRLDIAARPWPRPLPAYACVSLVALDGVPVRDSRRLLLAASARTENTGMAWSPDRATLVEDGWGKPPTLSEAVPLTLTLPWERLEAAALGPDGRVTGSLPANGSQLTLGPDVRTLWVLLTR